MKAIVVYDSKSGNCKKVAESIAQGLAEAGAEASAYQVKQVDKAGLASADIIAAGAPVWAGRPLRSIRKFVSRLGDAGIESGTLAFFDTYGAAKAGPHQGTPKLESLAKQSVPGAKIITPGFSGHVVKMRGPLEAGTEEKAREFGKKLAGEAGGVTASV